MNKCAFRTQREISEPRIYIFRVLVSEHSNGSNTYRCTGRPPARVPSRFISKWQAFDGAEQHFRPLGSNRHDEVDTTMTRVTNAISHEPGLAIA